MTNTGETFNRWAARLIGAAAAALILLLIWIAPPPQRAQAQGFGPATTWNQTVTWSGASYTYVPQPSDILRNIGQASHYFQVCANEYVATDAVQVEGSFNGSVWFPISTSVTVPPNGCQSVSAGGYWPDVRLNVTTLTPISGHLDQETINAYYSASVLLERPALGVSSGDPCQDPTVLKKNGEILVAAAGTYSLLAPPADGASLYICGINFTLTGTTPGAFFLVGSGSDCNTGTTDLTGTYSPTSGTFLNLAMGSSTILSGGPGEGFCIETTGTSPTADGSFTYVEQ
jgi:hypothetical protein